MAGSVWGSALKKMKKHHGGAVDAANEMPSGGGGFGVGRHVAFLVAASRSESPQGNKQVEWSYYGATGDEEGNTHKYWSNLESAEDLKFFYKILDQLEFEHDEDDLEDEDSFDAMLERLVEERLLVRLNVVVSKSNADYNNTYVNKLLDASDYDDLSEPPEAEKGSKKKKSKSKPKPADDDDDDEDDKKSSKSKSKTKNEKVEDDDEEEEETAKKPTKGKKKAEPEPEEDEEEDVTYEMVMKMKQAELIELIEENELKVNKKSPIPQLRKSVCKELELEPEEEEEEEEAPKKKAKK